LQFAINKQGAEPITIRPTFTQIGDTVIGPSEWSDGDGTREQRYIVLTFRDGKIVDLQACRSRRAALRFARRR
jgi:hypothetical protein